MSPCRRRLVAALAATALLLPAGPVGASQPRPEALDIDFGVTDLVLSVESLDSSVSDAESATQVQTTLAADVLFEFNRAAPRRRGRSWPRWPRPSRPGPRAP